MTKADEKPGEAERCPWKDSDGSLKYDITQLDDGWYHFDAGYPDEGMVGPYSTRALCEMAARAVYCDDIREIDPDLGTGRQSFPAAISAVAASLPTDQADEAVVAAAVPELEVRPMANTGRQPAEPAASEGERENAQSKFKAWLSQTSKRDEIMTISSLQSALAASEARTAEMTQARDRLYDRIEPLTTELVSLRSQLSAAQAEIARLQSERDSLYDSLEIQTERDDAEKTRLATEIERLRSELHQERVDHWETALELNYERDMFESGEIERLRGLLERAKPYVGPAVHIGDWQLLLDDIRSALAYGPTKAPATDHENEWLRAKLAAVELLANQWWHHGDEVDALYAEKLRKVLEGPTKEKGVEDEGAIDMLREAKEHFAWFDDAAARKIIEADRRAAKLEALREAYDRCCKKTFVVGALYVIQAMAVELEREGGANEG